MTVKTCENRHCFCHEVGEAKPRVYLSRKDLRQKFSSGLSNLINARDAIAYLHAGGYGLSEVRIEGEPDAMLSELDEVIREFTLRRDAAAATYGFEE